MTKNYKMMVSDAFRMVSDGPGHSGKVREAPGQKLKKVEKKSKIAKILKCERFSTNFRSVNDSLQFSDFQGLRNLGLRVQIS